MVNQQEGLGFSYLGCGVSLHGCCSKAQPLLLTLDEGYLLYILHDAYMHAQSCPTLCDPMDCSTPGFLVHHQLPELPQTHVHRVGDAIQPSHPLSSPFPPSFNPSQHQDFSKESTLRMRWPKYWSFTFSISPSNEHPGLISFRMD